MEFDASSLNILWSDDNIIAVNKPSGLLTIPDGYRPDLPCAVNLLQEDMGHLWVVHRLDKETSGVLVFARNAWTHKSMNEQFQNRLVQKVYRAIIVGNPPWERQEITFQLKVDGDRKHRTRVNMPGSKSAQTDIILMTRFSGYSFVEARPHTGYTHQIRAHLFAVGFPIVSDPLYDKSSFLHSQILSRLGLHAFQITIIHPKTAIPQVLTAPYPEDFQAALNRLNRLNS
jgi:tRNA pseudouridine32 synthase/23S rRNA pseudouridine746 synthase